MKQLNENNTIIGMYKKDVHNEWITQKIDKNILNYILQNGYKLQNEYNESNNENITVDFIEILIDKKNLEIKYYYGNGYILTYEEWNNKKELLQYIKNKVN